MSLLGALSEDIYKNPEGISMDKMASLFDVDLALCEDFRPTKTSRFGQKIFA
jgi:hypothetical protein